MAGRTQFEAEITDPTTGDCTTIRAHSEAELDRLVEEHLGLTFPEML